MLQYIIDGNNLIGKIGSLKKAYRQNRQSSREGLIKYLNAFLADKKINLTLHFDGYPNGPLYLSKGRIIYSEHRTSDTLIKDEIDRFKNPKLIVLVSSDHNLINYARVNSCKVIKSEEFKREMQNSSGTNEEFEKVKKLEREKEIFLKLFTQE